MKDELARDVIRAVGFNRLAGQIHKLLFVPSSNRFTASDNWMLPCIVETARATKHFRDSRIVFSRITCIGPKQRHVSMMTRSKNCIATPK